MRLVIVGGSDAGVGTALRARELDPGAEVTVLVADAGGAALLPTMFVHA
jgi:NADPH-dependent 2,4-dienoyl-CoA reductase/sulfur reductase-like enzyme